MKVDITGINKAQLLRALFNNAKNSQLMADQITVAISLAQFLGSSKVDRRVVDAHIKALTITDEDADNYLNSQRYINSVGDIMILMDLSGDEVDTTRYDQIHGCSDGGTPDLAKNIVAKLRNPQQYASVSAPFYTRYGCQLMTGAVVAATALAFTVASCTSNNK